MTTYRDPWLSRCRSQPSAEEIPSLARKHRPPLRAHFPKGAPLNKSTPRPGGAELRSRRSYLDLNPSLCAVREASDKFEIFRNLPEGSVSV